MDSRAGGWSFRGPPAGPRLENHALMTAMAAVGAMGEVAAGVTGTAPHPAGARRRPRADAAAHPMSGAAAHPMSGAAARPGAGRAPRRAAGGHPAPLAAAHPAPSVVAPTRPLARLCARPPPSGGGEALAPRSSAAWDPPASLTAVRYVGKMWRVGASLGVCVSAM